MLSLLLPLLLVLGLYFAFGDTKENDILVKTPLAAVLNARVTNNGKVVEAVISPTGDKLIFSSKEKEALKLFSKALPSGGEQEFSRLGTGQYRELSFAPDGGSLYYVGPDDALYQMKLPAGAVKQLWRGITGAFAVAPDNTRFAFVRATGPEETALLVAQPGAGETVIARRRTPESFADSALAWSPDGQQLACVVKRTPDAATVDVVTVAAAGGGEQVVIAGRWGAVLRLVWLPDSARLAVNAREPQAESAQLYLLPLAAGAIQPLTAEGASYRGLSVTKDGGSLASVKEVRPPNASPGSDVVILSGYK